MPLTWLFNRGDLARKDRPLRRRIVEERETPRALVIAVRIALLLAVPIVVHVLFPLERDQAEVQVRLGEISQAEVIAPFSFPIRRDPIDLERARTEAGRAVPPVLDLNTTLATESTQRLRRLGRELMRPPSENLPPEELRAALERALGVGLSRKSVEFLRTPEGQQLIDQASSYLEQALSMPIVEAGTEVLIAGHDVVNARRGTTDFYRPAAEVMTLASARATAEEAATEVNPPTELAREAFRELVVPFVAINAVLNQEETAKRAQEARDDVPEIVGMVHKGERIIDSHERITAEQVLKIQSLEAHRRELALGGGLGGGLLAGLGRFGLIMLLTATMLIYLGFQHPRINASPRSLALLATLVSLQLFAAWLLVDHFGQSELLVPVAMLPLLAAVLLNRGVALLLAFLGPILLVGLKNFSPEFLIAGCVAGVAVALAAQNVKRRHELFQPVLLVALANLITVTSLGLAAREPFSAVAAKMAAGVLNAGLTGIVAIVLLPLLEKVFRITTNFTLIELLDRNHPLLKRMAMEAPGTFHHSMLVAELAREAAEVVGGNPLLAQVGAYYHDIGKMQMPEYFIENQTGKNRHDNLTPNMSCLILGAHVRDGIQMAREAGLPHDIIDFIPEHHGTNLMSFFYHKAQDRDPHVESSDFRYPGPRPHRKETAILMLADSVEATARSLEDPTPGRIRTVVKQIIDKRVEDGQLDGSSLTLSDLARVRDSFITVLDRFFHGRIQYPEAALRTRRMESEGAVGGPQGEMAPWTKERRGDGGRDLKRGGKRGVVLPDGDESVAIRERDEEGENASAGDQSSAAAPHLDEHAPTDRPARAGGL